MCEYEFDEDYELFETEKIVLNMAKIISKKRELEEKVELLEKDLLFYKKSFENSFKATQQNGGLLLKAALAGIEIGSSDKK